MRDGESRDGFRYNCAYSFDSCGDSSCARPVDAWMRECVDAVVAGHACIEWKDASPNKRIYMFMLKA